MVITIGVPLAPIEPAVEDKMIVAAVIGPLPEIVPVEVSENVCPVPTREEPRVNDPVLLT